MVHMTGFITIPEHDTIEFWLASDDGGEISIGNNTFGSWQDQRCSATMSGNLQLEAGSLPLDLWMYENSGVTCVMLAWKIDDNQWEIVPEWAFTTVTPTPRRRYTRRRSIPRVPRRRRTRRSRPIRRNSPRRKYNSQTAPRSRQSKDRARARARGAGRITQRFNRLPVSVSVCVFIRYIVYVIDMFAAGDPGPLGTTPRTGLDVIWLNVMVQS